MNGATNNLGNETGGNVPTGNPQNIGSQNLTPSQSNLQTNSADLLNNTNLRITEVDGYTLGVSTSQTTATTVAAPPNHTKTFTIVGISALIIVAIFAVTWLTGRHRTVY